MSPSAQILDGTATSKKVIEALAQQVQALPQTQKPKLVAVLVGNNPASEVYVSRKIKVAAKVGILSELLRFPEDVAEADLLAALDNLNQDPSVHAILVQLPLPRHIDTDKVLQRVAVEKDVDGFHPVNLGKLLMGIEPPAMPCTPFGIIQLLDAYNLSMEGLRAAVVGRSNIVGKPMTLLLTQRNATVTLCHSKTQNIDDILRDADIIVAAAGQPGLVKSDCIKPGAIIIDVGINRLPDGKLVGDVDFEAVSQHAGYITPVPGGVGPMTIAMLMNNTLRLFQFQQGQTPASLILA